MRLRLLPDDPAIGTAPFLFLLYTAFVFIAPLIEGTLASWAIALGSLAVFLPLFFLNFWFEGWKAAVIASALVLLGAVVMPVNWGASAYFVFAAAFFAYALPPRQAAAAIVAIVAVIAVETFAFDLPFWAWMPGGIGAVAVGFANVHSAENYRREQVLRRAREDVEEMAKVAERERIARDLHDLLGHTLSVIVLKSELASKLADRDPARAIQEIREVERVSREALGEVRRAVEGYRQHGLPGEIRNAREVLRAAGVAFDADVAPLTLPPRQETALALALRESITNVVRHAGATRCRVGLQAQDGQIVFTVRDDGRGGTPREGNGLSGMRARVAEAGGRVEIDGSIGMCVTITLPIRAPEAALAS
jgi:two-component system sensor histidine kinase DesK